MYIYTRFTGNISLYVIVGKEEGGGRRKGGGGEGEGENIIYRSPYERFNQYGQQNQVFGMSTTLTPSYFTANFGKLMNFGFMSLIGTTERCTVLSLKMLFSVSFEESFNPKM